MSCPPPCSESSSSCCDVVVSSSASSSTTPCATNASSDASSWGGVVGNSGLILGGAVAPFARRLPSSCGAGVSRSNSYLVNKAGGGRWENERGEEGESRKASVVEESTGCSTPVIIGSTDNVAAKKQVTAVEGNQVKKEPKVQQPTNFSFSSSSIPSFSSLSIPPATTIINSNRPGVSRYATMPVTLASDLAARVPMPIGTPPPTPQQLLLQSGTVPLSSPNSCLAFVFPPPAGIRVGRLVNTTLQKESTNSGSKQEDERNTKVETTFALLKQAELEEVDGHQLEEEGEAGNPVPLFEGEEADPTLENAATDNYVSKHWYKVKFCCW